MKRIWRLTQIQKKIVLNGPACRIRYVRYCGDGACLQTMTLLEQHAKDLEKKIRRLVKAGNNLEKFVSLFKKYYSPDWQEEILAAWKEAKKL